MIKVCILTVSDSAVQGTRADVSGPAVRKRCEELGWQVVDCAVVPDEIARISERLKTWIDSSRISLILTTGGTGVSARDVTPEATRSVIEREILGFGELMRSKGLEQTRFSPLSRALAGTRAQALIVNLPGSPSGALFSLGIIETLVPHVIQLLEGHTGHDSSDQDPTR